MAKKNDTDRDARDQSCAEAAARRRAYLSERFYGEALNFPRIRHGIVEALAAHVVDGRPSGGFVEAVLSNDLREALARADNDNRRTLHDIVSLLWNGAPAACWGCPENVKLWRDERRMEREDAAAAAHDTTTAPGGEAGAGGNGP